MNTLIVKLLPGIVEGVAKGGFATLFNIKCTGMGLLWRLKQLGSAAYEGLESSKEADYIWIPSPLRHFSCDDWPTLVLECGLSKLIERLEIEAGWWFHNSAGDVRIVILISVSHADKKVWIDQWELSTAPNPEVGKDSPQPTITVPVKTCHVEMVDGKATGGPLRLKFNKPFLRDPRQGEGDIVFTREDLQVYGAHVWEFSY